VAKGGGRARVVRLVGRASSIETVLHALLVQEGELRGFEPYDPPSISTEERVDLRGELAFTIDPETAKDFDDAISVRAEGGGLRVWVHIADVSYFVSAGSPLDHGAAERANSVYVPGLVAPMLPHSIADDACSLRPNEDRLTVTAEIPFSADLEPGKPVFYRSVIRSNERLTYSQAEAILAGEKAEPELAEALRLTNRISSELRRRRFDRGALRIESREINFAFDGRAAWTARGSSPSRRRTR